MKYHAEMVCRHIKYRYMVIHKSYVESIYFVVYLPYQEFRIIYSRVSRCTCHCETVYVENTKLALTAPVLVGKPEGKRQLGRPRRRWVDNIRMDLQEVGCEYMDWIGLAQDRDRWRTFVSAVMNLWVP